MFVQNDCLGVFKIAVCDKDDDDEDNDGAQGTRKISFIKKNWTRQLMKQGILRNRKLLEQGGCQGFFKLQIVMPSTAWKVSKYGVISGPYFPVFGLNTEI